MMALGMTPDQYWYDDVTLVDAYLEADKLRQLRKNDEAWLSGMYIYDAISRLSPILHAFAKKGTKPIPYMDKPYSIDKKREPPKESLQRKENERLRAILYFKNWARAVSKKFET